MPTRTTKTSSASKENLIDKASTMQAPQFTYFLLLIVVFVLGYFVARVQFFEKGNGGTTPTTAPSGQAAAPQAPSVPDPKDVLKKITNGHFPVKGNSNAKVKIVEFADFRCPFCERFFTDTEGQLIKDYVDTGKVAFIFRQYEFLGAASVVAGNAAECANEQGKFWEYHDWLYKNQPDESDTSMFNTDSMTTAAVSLGMNGDQFRSCLSANKYNANLQKDLSEGQSIGVSGTPTFYVNGQQLVGAQPYTAFKAIIDTELKK